MKNALRIGLLSGMGIGIYELMAYGMADADWFKVLFISAFCTLGAMITPAYRNNKTNKY